MNTPYQILLDIWEGNPDLDVETLIANGVVGLIVRLNDMVGGHHIDERFAKNWLLAKRFAVRTLYFVYNPWVSGKANFDWLMAHLPADFGRTRILVDIEVKYPGYSAATYATEVTNFVALVKSAGFPLGIYTGGWFLSVLSAWPSNVDYWWGAYPDVLTAAQNWSAYKSALATVNMSAFTKKSPGPARLWQCTGDGVRLEGFGGHAVDVSVFPGTLDELGAWLNVDSVSEPDPISEPDPVEAFDTRLTFAVQSDILNIRSGPGIGYADTGDKKRGDVIVPLGVGGTDVWILISKEPVQYVCAKQGGVQYLTPILEAANA